jgi:hypothetical protein
VKLSKIENGIVVNTIVVDPNNIPEGLDGVWSDDQTLAKGMVDDGAGNFSEPVYVIPTEKINRAIDKKLALTDWTQVADVNLTPSEKAEWNNYRSLLRAMDRSARPASLGFPIPTSSMNRNNR